MVCGSFCGALFELPSIDDEERLADDDDDL